MFPIAMQIGYSGVGSIAAVAAMAATVFRAQKMGDAVQQRTRKSPVARLSSETYSKPNRDNWSRPLPYGWGRDS